MTTPVSHVTSWASRPGLHPRASRAAHARHHSPRGRTSRYGAARLSTVVSAPPPAIETTSGGW